MADNTFDRAMDKLRDELAKEKGGKLKLLGEGLTAMLQRHPEWAENILETGRSILGALDAVKKNAVGGCSDPVRTTKTLIDYYKLPCKDPRRLALEVTAGMMGGDEGTGNSEQGTGMAAVRSGDHQSPPLAPDPVDPFDLDALMGVM